MTGMSIGFPPTDVLLGLGVQPATTVTSTASPKTPWFDVSKHYGVLFSVYEAAATATGNGWTGTMEVSEIASSSGTNFTQVPFFARTVATTGASDNPGASTALAAAANWGPWVLQTTAGIVNGVSTAGRYLQAWISQEGVRSSTGLSAITKGSTGDASTVLANRYVRFNVTSAGTSSGGIMAIMPHWVSPRYEQATPTPYSTVAF